MSRRKNRGIGDIGLIVLVVIFGVMATLIVMQYDRNQKLTTQLEGTKAGFARYVQMAEDTSRLEGERARLKEQLLTQQAKTAQEDRDAKVAAISVDLERALGELRKRPARPVATAVTAQAGPPAEGGAVQGCTGRELFAPDAEFLAREAARADELLADYDELFVKYSAAAAIQGELTP